MNISLSMRQQRLFREGPADGIFSPEVFPMLMSSLPGAIRLDRQEPSNNQVYSIDPKGEVNPEQVHLLDINDIHLFYDKDGNSSKVKLFGLNNDDIKKVEREIIIKMYSFPEYMIC